MQPRHLPELYVLLIYRSLNYIKGDELFESVTGLYVSRILYWHARCVTFQSSAKLLLECWFIGVLSMWKENYLKHNYLCSNNAQMVANINSEWVILLFSWWRHGWLSTTKLVSSFGRPIWLHFWHPCHNHATKASSRAMRITFQSKTNLPLEFWFIGLLTTG